MYGPSNQVVSHQEALTLAALLGCHAIVAGITNHYMEGSGNGTERSIMVPFDAVFDRWCVWCMRCIARTLAHTYDGLMAFDGRGVRRLHACAHARVQRQGAVAIDSMA